MKATTILLAVGMFLVLVASSSTADVLRVSPSQAAVLQSSGDGVTRLALQFDLSGLRSGAGRKIVWAYLEWTITSAGTGDKTFAALPITTSWTASQVNSRTGSVTYSETPASDWDLTQDEQDRLGCVVRLNAKDLVSSWASGLTSNYGLVVTTREISGNTLAGQLENAQLVVGYGFYGQ